jgi:hypothetical protein
VYVNVSVSGFSIPHCPISRKRFRDVTIRNGQSRKTEIDIHKKNTLDMGQSGMDNLETLTLTYTRNVSVSTLPIPHFPISNVFFFCMPMSVSLDFPFLIIPSLRSFSCLCQCRCLEIGQSGMDNLKTLTLTYTRKRR